VTRSDVALCMGLALILGGLLLLFVPAACG
jgi:hypothetical protein